MSGNYGVKGNMHETVLLVGLRQRIRQKQACGTGISFIKPEALLNTWEQLGITPSWD